MAEVKLSIEEYHNVVKNLNTLIKKLYETTKKCKDYKRQRDELINDMAETKKKAKAFDEIDDLIVNGTLKDREPDAIFQNICHVIINFKERSSNVEI
ncbi:hypothetical protein LLE83_00230 [Staphylococcus epidermidis]|uniref:hypothetical protein n=1 Tax=Staphylococcus epidermidis TaxID=1282 RepID=UPI001D14185B|nr:hypothetical protein [Staphylococcus epidermidis]MCC3691906.1 hypothetical protein [Staphylococcus epidermidis]